MAIFVLLVNRLCDGLDGAVARQLKPTSKGAYIDIVLDFIFYAAIVFAFALYNPAEYGVYAAFVIFSFIGTASSFLAYAIFEKEEEEKIKTQKKSFFHLSGLTEGFETIVFIILICLFPQYFPEFSLVFGTLCCITSLSRIHIAYSRL